MLPGGAGLYLTEMELIGPERPVDLRLVSGFGHYRAVVQRVRSAEFSVWIVTANLKELMVQDLPLDADEANRRAAYRSSLELFDRLCGGGVELRVLHARLPSRAFRDAFDRHPKLVRGGMQLRLCPRVHLKAVIIDGSFLYLGSANWTGAGLGIRSPRRRNFELGVITEDSVLLDQVQGMVDDIWSGRQCGACELRSRCEAPLDI